MTITYLGQLAVNYRTDANQAQFAMIAQREVPAGRVLVWGLAVDNHQTTDGDEGAVTSVAVEKAGWSPDASPGVTVDWTFAYRRGYANDDDYSRLMQVAKTRSSGKWYFEATPFDDANDTVGIGIGNLSANRWDYAGGDSGSIAVFNDGSVYWNDTLTTDIGSGWTNGTTPIIGVAVDLDTNTIWFRVNGGNWNGSALADPETGNGGIEIPVAGALSPCGSVVLDSGGEYIDIDLDPREGSPEVSKAPAGFTNWDVPVDVTFAKAVEHCNGNGSAQAGVTCSAWYVKVSETIPEGSVINGVLTNSTSRDAASGIIWEFESTGPIIEVDGTPGTLSNDAADPGSLNVTTTSGEWLRMRLIASESSSSTSLTVTSNFTSLGAAWFGVGLRGEFRIVTGTSAASDPTLFSADHASVYFALRDLALGFSGGGTYASGRADQGHNSGKRYFEVTIERDSNSAMSPPVGSGIGVGLSVAGAQLDLAVGNMSAAYSVGLYTDGYMLTDTGTDTDLGLPSDLLDTIRCAVDFDTGKVWLGNADGWDGDPEAGTGESDSFTPGTMLFPTFTVTSLNDKLKANFGATDLALPLPSGFQTWDA